MEYEESAWEPRSQPHTESSPAIHLCQTEGNDSGIEAYARTQAFDHGIKYAAAMLARVFYNKLCFPNSITLTCAMLTILRRLIVLTMMLRVVLLRSFVQVQRAV
jgi:hypothetical protein